MMSDMESETNLSKDHQFIDEVPVGIRMMTTRILTPASNFICGFDSDVDDDINSTTMTSRTVNFEEQRDDGLGNYCANTDHDSIHSHKFISTAMKKLIALRLEEPIHSDVASFQYKSDSVLPPHILGREEWAEAVKKHTDNAISDILKIPSAARTQIQTNTLIEFM